MGCSHCSLRLGHMGVLKMHMCATQQIDARKKNYPEVWIVLDECIYNENCLSCLSA